MTRIIAGVAGGRRLVSPPGHATRPTSDRVREALFSHLEHQGLLDDTAVLDLYAGSGALGLEAASRGARAVVLVDHAAAAVRVIRTNVSTLDLPGVAVVADRVERVLVVGPGPAAEPGSDRAPSPPRSSLARAAAPYDLVLADPPYPLDEAAIGGMLTALVTGDWLAAGAVVVLERSTRSPEPRWPDGLVPTGCRDYGETRLWFARCGEPVVERIRGTGGR